MGAQNHFSKLLKSGRIRVNKFRGRANGRINHFKSDRIDWENAEAAGLFDAAQVYEAEQRLKELKRKQLEENKTPSKLYVDRNGWVLPMVEKSTKVRETLSKTTRYYQVPGNNAIYGGRKNGR